MQLFSVISRHNQWLSVRQSTIAGNIANANTPGFRSQDVQPFEIAVEQARLAMAATQPGHIATGAPNVVATEVRREAGWETSLSGNNVTLEQELMKAGEVNRSYRLNTSIAKVFHRMLMTSARV
jgi:flagellar basal-body rod protein FlgB